MKSRFLVIFPIFAAAGLDGQFEPPGLSGPVIVHLEGGDVAPDIRFENLHSATGVTWNQGNLSAHLSALVFFPTSTTIQTW
jgi:hypothetical protein